ncbi:glycosyltransferase [Vibrio cholerae]|uniref:glycosyltransferase n=1 Tax=Vibrio cholerae TaxID=666 RepID=UPI0004E39765|nr:glycosyltransferase [Vibrio cholerae]EGQ9391381.1 glycosyltransferase family 2 protein [Vibrio cholerae]EGR2312107.1 glycosyltransferase [Vibrio cholerae]EGR3989907.1 glycosyltransferase [Vibrio cholerae]KFD97893.1 glycosyl transferase 2 family protein [Vibrio cholerae]BCN17921.1 putative glycosyltransferase [Vibrio cholerae]
MTIDVLVSTLNDGLYNLKISDNKLKYKIIHQITNEKKDEYNKYYYEVLSKGSFVKYYPVFEKGLSKSRNYAISKSESDIIWFMDDDVKILENAYENIISVFNDLDCDCVVFNHTSDKKLLRSFFIEQKKTAKILNLYNSTGVSSIDICLRRSSLSKDADLKFDESFGLGSNNPSGEEYIFISDLIKAGKKVFKSSLVTSYHKLEASGLDFFSSREKLYAKRNMLVRIFGLFKGNAFFIAFLIKKIPYIIKNKHVKTFITSLILR